MYNIIKRDYFYKKLNMLIKNLIITLLKILVFLSYQYSFQLLLNNFGYGFLMMAYFKKGGRKDV
jgi:hypothetical protein